MATSKTLWASALWVFIAYSCGRAIPAKTNVLSKSDTAQMVRSEPEVKKSPAPKSSGKTSAPYKSREYYKRMSDDMQKSYVKADYQKKIDEIVRQISVTPGKSNNPAVTADEWSTSEHFNIRKPNFVVLHHTAESSAEKTIHTFSVKQSEVSAHYVVGRDGVVYQILNDYVRSWHAGNGKWGNITDMNSCSIGIEIDNNGEEPFSNEQIEALIKLLEFLKKQYSIPQANFIAHSDVAPGRKQDPSKYFPWKKLADAGFGYWYDSNNMVTPPADFNALLALRAIGYDVSDKANAISAFKLHFIQNDISSTLTDYDKKVLYNLYRKF